MSGRWISTKTRLPKKQTTVLFASPGNFSPKVGHIVDDGRWYDVFGGCMIVYSVTHWRPMPKMPRYKKSERTAASNGTG